MRLTCLQDNVVHRVQRLFKDDTDLMQGFYHFLPDRNLQQRMVARLDEMEDGAPFHLDPRQRGKKLDGGLNVPLSKAQSASASQKRKRKPVDKDKSEIDKDKHKDIVSKPGANKV